MEDFRERVSPPTLMTQEELPPIGDVVLGLGAGANPHPRATIHHDRIVRSIGSTSRTTSRRSHGRGPMGRSMPSSRSTCSST
jgi:hypothetical protein